VKTDGCTHPIHFYERSDAMVIVCVVSATIIAISAIVAMYKTTKHHTKKQPPNSHR